MAIVNTLPNGGAGFDYQVVEYRKSISTSANTHVQVFTEAEIKALAPSGYQFLGWLTFTSGLARVVPSILADNAVFAYTIGSAGSATFVLTALYVKE